jgi:hypothetical protein
MELSKKVKDGTAVAKRGNKFVVYSSKSKRKMVGVYTQGLRLERTTILIPSGKKVRAVYEIPAGVVTWGPCNIMSNKTV